VLELALDLDVRSVRSARHYVREQLARHHCPSELIDDVGLLVSELVTNAVVHGSPGIRLVLKVQRRCVRVEVSDGTTTGPQRLETGREASSGRGLVLVDRLASRWSVEASDEGKTVWFEVDLPS